MTRRTQFIVLVVLLGVLAAVAFIYLSDQVCRRG